jgi:predicted anti-sigma-YlaC factor YlaD
LRIDCKEASRLLSQAMDQDLPLWDRARLRLHLAACDACANFSRQLELLRRAVARLLE